MDDNTIPTAPLKPRSAYGDGNRSRRIREVLVGEIVIDGSDLHGAGEAANAPPISMVTIRVRRTLMPA